MATAQSIYLDYAAATPVDPRVLEAMQPYFSEQFYNPSATYRSAERVAAALQAARASVAHWLGTRASEIVFTAGGSEANNLAIHGIMRRFPDAHMVVSAVEHESVLAAAKHYAYKEATVLADGMVDLQALEQSIDGQTVLVSIMYANNEVGTIEPLRQIGQLIQAIRAKRQKQGNTLPLYLHSDACQAAAYLDLHVARLGVDLLTINGGKIYGPKQSGALYVRAGLVLEPIVDGGGQEYGLRSGTENVAACIGLAKALELVQTDRHTETARLQTLQQQFLKAIEQQLSPVIINGSRTKRLPNNVHLTLPGQDNERLLIALDERGIMAAAGSACSASNEEPSHVLKAMGISEADAQSSLRFTFGHGTSAAYLTHTVDSLAQLLA